MDRVSKSMASGTATCTSLSAAFDVRHSACVSNVHCFCGCHTQVCTLASRSCSLQLQRASRRPRPRSSLSLTGLASTLLPPATVQRAPLYAPCGALFSEIGRQCYLATGSFQRLCCGAQEAQQLAVLEAQQRQLGHHSRTEDAGAVVREAERLAAALRPGWGPGGHAG